MPRTKKIEINQKVGPPASEQISTLSTIVSQISFVQMILQFNNLSKKMFESHQSFFRDNLLSMMPDNNNRIMSHNNVTVENHRFKSWFDLKCIGRLPQNALLQKRSKIAKNGQMRSR